MTWLAGCTAPRQIRLQVSAVVEALQQLVQLRVELPLQRLHDIGECGVGGGGGDGGGRVAPRLGAVPRARAPPRDRVEYTTLALSDTGCHLTQYTRGHNSARQVAGVMCTTLAASWP